MTALVVTRDNLRFVKSDLTEGFPEVKSSHLTEALARALGFNTNAALLARFSALPSGDPDILLLDEDAFYERLSSLGYTVQREEDVFGWLEDKERLLNTTPIASFDIKYSTQRMRAWRNLMVSAVNVGIEHRLFTVKEGDNRWPGFDASNRQSTNCEYDFTVAGLPARAAVRDISFGELAIHVAVHPTGEFLEAGPIKGFHAGEAHAGGWLERREGAWLQSANTQFACRKRLQPILAELDVKPIGYGDRGQVMM